MAKRQGIPAAAFMASFSAAGRIAPAPAQTTPERRQIIWSTTAQLADRRAALRERYDPAGDGGGYPVAQLRELHLIERELEYRSDRDDRASNEREDRNWVADNHTALWNATDIEPSLKRRGY